MLQERIPFDSLGIVGTDREKNRPNTRYNISRKLAALAMVGLSIIGVKGDARLDDEVMFSHDNETELADYDTMTIMTANVRSWRDSPGNNFGKFIDTVQDQAPDVICMQEVLADGPELYKLHQEGYNVFFGTTFRYPFRGRFGNAVASKLKISDIETMDLPSANYINPREVIFFSVDTGRVKLNIANTHLDREPPSSSRQMRVINAKAGEYLDFGCGDFNTPRDDMIASPLGNMVDPRIIYARHNTFPTRNPKRQIDHIISYCGTPTGEPILSDIGSDHLGLIKVFDISECDGERDS